jgi:hypothetical protein
MGIEIAIEIGTTGMGLEFGVGFGFGRLGVGVGIEWGLVILDSGMDMGMGHGPWAMGNGIRCWVLRGQQDKVSMYQGVGACLLTSR